MLKIKKIRTIVALLIFSYVMFNFSGVEAGQNSDDQEIMVIGTSTIYGDNVASARNNAISDALLKGVEDYFTISLGNQGMVSNFSRLINEVIPDSGDVIENFHILAEDNSGKSYKILARIKVNEKLMEEKLKDLGIVIMEELPLKILLLVSQKIDQEGEVIYWWNDPESNSPLTSTELVLYRVLQEFGFNPINRLLSVPEGEYSSGMIVPELADEDAIEWGRIFSSEVVISGKSEILQEEMVFLNLKAIDVGKGTVISQDIRVAPIEHDDSEEYDGTYADERYMNTLEEAVNSLVIQLSPAMISSFEKVEEEINLFEIEVTGLKSFEQYGILYDFIEGEIIGVKSVIPRRIKRDSITIMIEFSGNQDSFLTKLKGNPGFPFRAEINKSEEGNLVFKIK